MSRRKRRKQPKGYSEQPVKSVYDMILGKLGVSGKEKKAILNDFALWTAAVAGLGVGAFAGTVVGQAFGVTAGVVAGIVAGSAAFAYAAARLTRGRYWRP
jgi:hypothetical protein